MWITEVPPYKISAKSEAYEILCGKVYLWTYVNQALLWISMARNKKHLTTFRGISYKFQHLQTGYVVHMKKPIKFETLTVLTTNYGI
jgi:hypothetical protein